eukprot:CAMPEP_0197656310 /NCGR_PEP_ID=MMETSP1338-20131121/41270_1 /TAXON_ID=43686 ORGANISM="Pelagodinium beii, Strain RCC1491" /NCGR_SAMPLE_ID=MMETSP1338 /ASSEMBLY_ACC=CAM_ASM_000754 /LENGTH=49 /DNA_ID= /DNA_START= /DNA_END= /DNA_ORIENTATION=
MPPPATPQGAPTDPEAGQGSVVNSALPLATHVIAYLGRLTSGYSLRDCP